MPWGSPGSPMIFPSDSGPKRRHAGGGSPHPSPGAARPPRSRRNLEAPAAVRGARAPPGRGSGEPRPACPRGPGASAHAGHWRAGRGPRARRTRASARAGDPRGTPPALLAAGPAHPERPAPDPRRPAGRPPAPRARAPAQRLLSAAPRAPDAQRRHQQARGAPAPAPGRGSTCAAQGRRTRTREAARDPHARRPEIHPLTNPRGGATVPAAKPTTGSQKEGPFSAPETGSPEVMVHSAPSPLVARIWGPKTGPLFSTAAGCARPVEMAGPRNCQGERTLRAQPVRGAALLRRTERGRDANGRDTRTHGRRRRQPARGAKARINGILRKTLPPRARALEGHARAPPPSARHPPGSTPARAPRALRRARAAASPATPL